MSSTNLSHQSQISMTIVPKLSGLINKLAESACISCLHSSVFIVSITTVKVSETCLLALMSSTNLSHRFSILNSRFSDNYSLTVRIHTSQYFLSSQRHLCVSNLEICYDWLLAYLWQRLLAYHASIAQLLPIQPHKGLSETMSSTKLSLCPQFSTQLSLKCHLIVTGHLAGTSSPAGTGHHAGTAK